MSLLLDALRRAGAARGERVAEPVASASRGSDSTDPPTRSEVEDGAVVELPTPSAGDAQPPSGPARAEAVFRGAAAGRRPSLRAAFLWGVGAVAVLGAVATGGWYYYTLSRSQVDQDLARYAPDPGRAEPAATATTADAEATGGEGGGGSAGAASAAEATTAASGTDTGTGTGTGTGTDTDTDTSPSASGGDGGGGSADAPDPDAPSVAAADEGDRDPSRAPQAAVADAPQTDPGTDAAAGTSTAQRAQAQNGPGTGASGDAADANGPSDSGGSAATATASGDDPVRASAEGGDAAADGTGKVVAAQGSTEDPPAAMVRSTNGQPTPLSRALRSGYRALRDGDLDGARKHYRRAVELAPANRDARLGAAAVAQRDGETARAIEHYRAVLADHPRDPYARAGLAALAVGRSAQRSESELKSRLKEDPDAHALRFALGNIHAREGRWSAAQSAFFKAFRTAPGEADYAFNLAVALDHLGQREAARKYYERALDLDVDGAASFSRERAQRRLEQLEP